MLSRALARVLAEQRGPEFAEHVAWLHRAAGELRWRWSTPAVDQATAASAT